MKKTFWVSLCSFCLLWRLLSAHAQVTYDFSGGRFGDNLLAYLHAKWLAWVYNVPLSYKPFPYSSELVFSDIEQIYVREQGRRIEYVNHHDLDQIVPEAECVYLCPYFPENPWDIEHYPGMFYFPIDWKNQTFRNLVKEAIAPKSLLDIIKPPAQTINIAIHVREGGGFDDQYNILGNPLKIPPFIFYVEALQKILDRIPGASVYCFLFTDAICPQELVDKLRRSVYPS